MTTVVDSRGPRITVSCEELDRFEWDVLAEQISDYADANGVRGQPLGQIRIPQPPFHHAGHVDRRHAVRCQFPGPSDRGPEQGS